VSPGKEDQYQERKGVVWETRLGSRKLFDQIQQ